jgi:DNA polymerase iota
MMHRVEVAHPRIVIHVDIDYFYAQVEEVLNPELKDKRLGVQQGVNIVTYNYIARSFGVKKSRPLKECLEKCPELVTVNGEDLSNYKIYSKKIAELLHTTIGPSERMGLDEHYMDNRKMIDEQLSDMSQAQINDLRMAGPFYPREEAFDECQCGCKRRLMLGSHIAQNIRKKILEELKLTCSVGIAHNKILAKLVGQFKPDNQTVLAPTSAASFMAELKDLRFITGIGGKTASLLEELGITTIRELQNNELSKLQKRN